MTNGTIITNKAIFRKRGVVAVTKRMINTEKIKTSKKRKAIKDKEKEIIETIKKVEIIRIIIVQTTVKMELSTITDSTTIIQITETTTITEEDTITTTKIMEILVINGAQITKIRSLRGRVRRVKSTIDFDL